MDSILNPQSIVKKEKKKTKRFYFRYYAKFCVEFANAILLNSKNENYAVIGNVNMFTSAIHCNSEHEHKGSLAITV